jgi:RNA polymerase sigma-70 factor, ECF subfamily
MREKGMSYRDENILIKEIQEKNLNALDELYRLFGRLVFSYALKLLNGDRYSAEEITQDVFMKIWKKAHLFDQSKKLSTWLLTITKNTTIDYMRKSSKFTKVDIDKLAEIRESEVDLDVAVMTNQLKEEIKKLPPDQRKVIELMYMQGHTQKEIAELLNIPLGTVKSRVKLGINRLRRQMQKWEVQGHAK